MPSRKYKRPPYCKPCWELKYCPYGILIETMPLPPLPERAEAPRELREEMYERSKKTLLAVKPSDDAGLWGGMFFVLYADPMKWEHVKQYDSMLTSCRGWGHMCPVFYYATDRTETKELRKTGRKISRDIMFKVARRDDYRCRMCGQPVPDHLVEFDHIIPHAKGGPTSIENIRLLCRTCNRKKADSLRELLDPTIEPI